MIGFVERSEAFEVENGGVVLSGEAAGEGIPIALLHGLTATRRYVVSGSRALERSGFRTLAYDARGHGESAPAPTPAAYGYHDLALDLLAVLDHAGTGRAVLAGASMGAHSALRVALDHPDRVAGLVLITPAYLAPATPGSLATWDRLADGLERGGVDGFLAVYEPETGERWRDTVMLVARQRLERHLHPQAVADAIRAVSRSEPFPGLEALEQVSAPALVVGSHDEADPGHPLAVARAYAERLPRGELVTEEPGRSPLAWQGAQLSRAIAAFVERSVPQE